MSENTKQTLPRLMTKKEVAEYLGYSTRTIDQMVTNRIIPFLAIPTRSGQSTRRMFDPNDIEKWVNSFKHEADPVVPCHAPSQNPSHRVTAMELMLGG